MIWIGAGRSGADSAGRQLDSPWLVDEFVASYAGWRMQSGAAREAYEDWASRDADDPSAAFAAYRAALDREELAAQAYQACAERIAGRRR
jgi:hypothetical protein